jgi:hypothetical protein
VRALRWSVLARPAAPEPRPDKEGETLASAGVSSAHSLLAYQGMTTEPDTDSVAVASISRLLPANELHDLHALVVSSLTPEQIVAIPGMVPLLLEAIKNHSNLLALYQHVKTKRTEVRAQIVKDWGGKWVALDVGKRNIAIVDTDDDRDELERRVRATNRDMAGIRINERRAGHIGSGE